MRTAVIKTLIAVALSTLSLTAFTAAPAAATAPAPFCESGGREFYCEAATSSPTVTWSVTWASGTVGTFTTGSFLYATCPYSSLDKLIKASYSYVDAGGTQYSATSTFWCRSGPWL